MLYRPFGRLWWDETVPTVVTRAEPHNQVKALRYCWYIYGNDACLFFAAVDPGWIVADYFASQPGSSSDHPGKCKTSGFPWLLQAVWPYKAEVSFSRSSEHVGYFVINAMDLVLLWRMYFSVLDICRLAMQLLFQLLELWDILLAWHTWVDWMEMDHCSSCPRVSRELVCFQEAKM